MDLNIRQQLRDIVGDMVNLLEQGAANPNAPPAWKLKAQTATTKARIIYEIIRRNLASGEAFYFGSLGGEHRLFDSTLLPVTVTERVNVTEIPDVIVRAIDGGLLPDTDTEGVARVQVIEGWTVVAFHDRSADRRMGSHSTFVFKGTYPAEEGVLKAAELFPTVFERYPFSVILQT